MSLSEVERLVTWNMWLQSFLNLFKDVPFSIKVSTAEWHQVGFPIIYVNKAFETLTQYNRTETLGKPCAFLTKRNFFSRKFGDERPTSYHGSGIEGRKTNKHYCDTEEKRWYCFSKFVIRATDIWSFGDLSLRNICSFRTHSRRKFDVTAETCEWLSQNDSKTDIHAWWIQFLQVVV